MDWNRARHSLASNCAGSVSSTTLEHRDEPSRRLELRHMADPFEDLQAAARDRLVGVLAVVDGDDRVPRSPHDQYGHALREVQPVAGVDALTTGLITERTVARKAARRSGSVSDA